MFIPSGFARVSPYMMIADADSLVVFLQQAFDAKALHISRRADGKIANAQMQIGDCLFMLSEASEAFRLCPHPIIYMWKMPLKWWLRHSPLRVN